MIKTTLNKQQEEAVNHVNGPCFVSAAPGSGKTKIIVERTINLIDNGISPRSILSLTFTNKAANEMKERIAKSVGNKVAVDIYMSTFHSMAANVLRKLGASIGYGSNMTIYDSDDQESFMAQVARQMGFEISAKDVSEIVWKINDLRENLEPEQEMQVEFNHEWQGKIALEYISKLRSRCAVDFSGLLYEFVRLLENDSSARSKLRNRFKYLQIDESQDLNKAQFKIVELLQSDNKDVFLVADLDQAIYQWRGAKPEGVKDFVTSTKACEIRLPMNYRCTPQIVAVASNLINNNPNRPKEWTFETSNSDGDPVACYSLPSPDLEGRWIGNQIKGMIEGGLKPENIAVLYRLNSMSRSIEAGLVNAQIPYQVIGGYGFYDRKEIRDGLAMLRFLINPNDGIALSRFINKPKRGIGEGALGKIESFAEQQNINLIQAMSRAEEFIGSTAVSKTCKEIANVFELDHEIKNIGETLSYLIDNLQYDNYLKTDKDSAINYDDRKDNQQELVNSAAVYSEETSNDIAAYLNNIALTTTSDKKTEEGRVSLMTMHAAKGLEFECVFLPRLEEGLMPHKRAVEERENGIEEERRLCYVAFTRAKKNLICTYPSKSVRKFGQGNVQFMHNKPSRFLKESDLLKNCKYVSYES